MYVCMHLGIYICMYVCMYNYVSMCMYSYFHLHQEHLFSILHPPSSLFSPSYSFTFPLPSSPSLSQSDARRNTILKTSGGIILITVLTITISIIWWANSFFFTHWKSTFSSVLPYSLFNNYNNDIFSVSVIYHVKILYIDNYSNGN